MKHSILLILVFAGLVSCALIPNKRVIVNNDDPDDYTLVEGVPYNIVHLKSRMNLNGDNYDVDVKNSNSYWSIQKAYDSLYNIIHLNSCRNLDSNIHKVYTSTPEYDNHYQHWEFTKIKNDTYNIKHPISQSRSLDSNGYSVYLGNEYKHYNPFQQWSFEPANYNLTALVTEFSYPPDLKDQLSRYKKRTNLLLGNITIKNPTNATITTTIDRIEKKLNSYTVEIRKAEFLGKKVSNRLSIFFHINAIVYEWLGINTGIDWNSEAEKQFVSQYEEIYRETISEEVTYGIKEQIMVPPFNSIEFGATIDQITVDIPFNATIRITGKADRLDEYGNVVPMTDVDIDALKCYLQKENYSIIKVVAEENSIIVSTNGTLKVDGYGLASTIETKPIFHDNPPDSNDPPTDFGDILWQYRQFIYFAGAFVIYKFGRKFFENRNYVEI